MKSIISIVLAYCLLSSFVPFPEGSGDYLFVIRKQAEDMGKALVSKNYAVYIQYTDPRIVKDMGGEAAFADSLKGYEAQWHKFGMSIYNINVEDPSLVIDTAGELQSTIPVTTQMAVKGGLVTTETTFIGISKDKGKTWVFIDATADYASIRKKYTDLSSKLVVPLPSEPIFKAD